MARKRKKPDRTQDAGDVTAALLTTGMESAEFPEASSREPSLAQEQFSPASRSRLLEGPLRSAVFWLALPVLGEQILNACVSWNDAWLAGRISAEATGAIGAASYLSWFMTMLFWMADTGATAIVSRAFGAKNYHEATRTTNQAFTLALVLGVLGTAFVMLIAPLATSLLNMQGSAGRIATNFMRIDAVGYLGASVSFALAACLRGAGDTRTPLMILGGVNVINFVFSRLFTFGKVFGFSLGHWQGMGVNGIAWGTTLARWLGALWIVMLLLAASRRKSGRDQKHMARRHIRLSLPLMTPDRGLLYRMLAIGLPASLDGTLAFGGHFCFMAIVNRIPSAFTQPVIYAAHIVGIRIESLSYLPAQAWGVAAGTMVGQNLGAGQPQRAKDAARAAVWQAAALLMSMGVVYYILAPQLFGLLSNDPRVWECGIPALRGLAYVQIPLAFLVVYLGALRGAGDTRTPMIITALGMLCVRIPLAWFGGFWLKWGLLGAWFGMYGDLTVRGMLITWRFGKGRWQRLKV